MSANITAKLAKIIKPYSGPDDGRAHVPLYANDVHDLKSILWSLYITPRNGVIILGSWGAAWGLGKIMGILGAKKKYILASKIILCFIICSLAVWAPGTRPDIRSTGYVVLLGFTLPVIAVGLPIAFKMIAEKYLPANAISALDKLFN